MCFDVELFRRMQTNGNMLQVQDHLSDRCDTAFTGWVNHWNHWGCCSSLRCRFIGKESDRQFLCHPKEVDYDLGLVYLLA